MDEEAVTDQEELERLITSRDPLPAERRIPRSIGIAIRQATNENIVAIFRLSLVELSRRYGGFQDIHQSTELRVEAIKRVLKLARESLNDQ